MKILFAVSNENIAEAIKREYQNNYKLQLVAKMYIILMQL